VTTGEWFLNFAADEGTYVPAGTNPDATGQEPTGYPEAWNDGNDHIFGDTGNDWLVGGTGRDNLYGGFGNDLLNADDYLETESDETDNKDTVDSPYDNAAPDTQPSYEDRAYGGAGRDVLIGNTGGDRLIDWVGEFNSYLVPFAPFGMATVSRTLQKSHKNGTAQSKANLAMVINPRPWWNQTRLGPTSTTARAMPLPMVSQKATSRSAFPTSNACPPNRTPMAAIWAVRKAMFQARALSIFWATSDYGESVFNGRFILHRPAYLGNPPRERKRY